MLLKFGGSCSFCKQFIPAGNEARYDGDSKTVLHWECFENPIPGPEAYALAERLGFISSSTLNYQPTGFCGVCVLAIEAIQPGERPDSARFKRSQERRSDRRGDRRRRERRRRRLAERRAASAARLQMLELPVRDELARRARGALQRDRTWEIERDTVSGSRAAATGIV